MTPRLLKHYIRSWLLAIVATVLVGMLAACAAQTNVSVPSSQNDGPDAETGIAEADHPAAATVDQEEADPLTGEVQEAVAGPESAIQTTEEPASARLAIVNGLLIDGTGRDPIVDAAVLVEDGLIRAVGPADEIELPSDAITVDAQGGAILPGIIEARASNLLNNLRFEDGHINPIDLEIYLYRTLKGGVTTVRATGWKWQEQQNLPVLRETLKAMGNTIPTIVISGTSLAHGEGAGFTKYYADQTIGASTVEEAVEHTEHLIELGVDQINLLMAVGPEIQFGRTMSILSSEQLRAIVETAHAHDRLVIAQAIFSDEVEAVIAAGADQVQNWPHLEEPMTDEMIATLVAHDVPLLTGFAVEKPLEGDVRRFLDAGGTLVYGTFAPNAGPLYAPFNEFQRMEVVGEMTPMEIIVAATANGAEAVGLGNKIGTLEVGKSADIIIVDGNPLDDLRVFRDGIAAVIKGGELVPMD